MKREDAHGASGVRVSSSPRSCLGALRFAPSLLVVALSLFPLGSHLAYSQQLADLSKLVAVLPDAPEPQPIPGTITGTIVDRDGDSISGARVTLARGSGSAIETTTAPDGHFSFPGVAPGAFRLIITASGFAIQQTAGEVHAGESLDLPAIALAASSSTNVQVTASQADIAQAQIQDEEKQRVLGFVPNFYVSYIPNPAPLTPKQKFELAYKTLLDPITVGINGVVAGVQQATNTYSSWGQDAPSYGKRFGAAYGTTLTDTLLSNAILPVLFKQDPRYFYKGTGTTRSRVLYAIANAVICKGDNMRWQPNYSGILGGLAAAGISNVYYPAADRQGAKLTFVNAGLGTLGSAGANLFQEFVVRRFTPHLPKLDPSKP